MDKINFFSVIMFIIVIILVSIVMIKTLDMQMEQVKQYCLDNPNGVLTGDLHVECNYTNSSDYLKTNRMT